MSNGATGKLRGALFWPSWCQRTTHVCPATTFPPRHLYQFSPQAGRGASGGLDGIIIDMLAARNWGKEICHQDKKAKRGEKQRVGERNGKNLRIELCHPAAEKTAGERERIWTRVALRVDMDGKGV